MNTGYVFGDESVADNLQREIRQIILVDGAETFEEEKSLVNCLILKAIRQPSDKEFTADQWKEAYMLGSENTEINNNKRTVLSAEHALKEYRRKRDGCVGI